MTGLKSYPHFDEFLLIANQIAMGERPMCTGRLMTRAMWKICDTLAAYHQSQTNAVEAENWRDYREVVLMTRLSTEDRNKIYDGDEP